jgi:hypothetical protein
MMSSHSIDSAIPTDDLSLRSQRKVASIALWALFSLLYDTGNGRAIFREDA